MPYPPITIVKNKTIAAIKERDRLREYVNGKLEAMESLQHQLDQEYQTILEAGHLPQR